jgi:DNA recombination protein RmuC
MHRLEAYLNSVQDNLDALQTELEGRYARALRMLSNSGNEMRTHLSQIRGGLAGVQIATTHAEQAEALPPTRRPVGGPPARH